MTKVKRGPTRTKVSANAQPPRDVLLTAETRLALVTETVTEGIYDWNVATNALWVSDRLKAILGIAGARSISKSWADRVHPEDLEVYKAAIVAHFKGETERLACEYKSSAVLATIFGLRTAVVAFAAKTDGLFA